MAKLLVADADREAADVLAEALRRNGHAVRTCYSGNQCAVLARDFHPDLVLLCKGDIDAVAVRQLREEVPIMTIAAHVNVNDADGMNALMQSIRRALA